MEDFAVELEDHYRSISNDRDKVELFIEKMKQGPRMSWVDESRVEWEDVTEEFREFGVKRSG